MERGRNVKELGLNDEQIDGAIEKARKGIDQYLDIMGRFPGTDVAHDRDFWRRFRAFYRVRRGDEWAGDYFAFMQQQKGHTPSFQATIEYLYRLHGRAEPSFSSKLVATLDPTLPVWDKWVLKNQRLKAPSANSKTKVADAVQAYEQMIQWYQCYMSSAEGRRIIALFRRRVPRHEEVTDLKKVDFVLWQLRDI